MELLDIKYKQNKNVFVKLIKKWKLIKQKKENEIFQYFEKINFNRYSLIESLKSIFANSNYNFRCLITPININIRKDK